MRKLVLSLVVLAGLSVALTSCYNSNSTYPNPSKLKFRAFISNPLFPAGVTNLPVLEVVDATLDTVSFSPISLAAAVPDASLMDLAANKKITAVYSPENNSFAVVDNANERVSLISVTLPDATESFFIAQDNLHLYAAVPNAPVTGHPPGAVIQIDISSGNITATIPVPHVHSIVQAMQGASIVAFSDNSEGACAPESGAVTVITPANIGTVTDPRVTICSFDHPVRGVVPAGQQKVFVLECGPQCGGSNAAVTQLDLTSNTKGPSVPVPAATAGITTGLTLYVAGTPPATPCGASTQATTCGTLTIIDTERMLVTNSAPIIITDGDHWRMELSANGQLFIGARNCTSINDPPTEVRGCLTIFNTNNSSVKVPPVLRDVTGMAPVPGRVVFYVIQDRELQVYDTTTDALLPNHQTNVVGQLYDVKIVDPQPAP